MAKWGTYPPDDQLRLKRDAAEELYDALALVEDRFGAHCIDPLPLDLCILMGAALAKARRGEA